MLLIRIKQLCLERKTSIPKLENELGFGAGTIYKWETASPSVQNLKKVADYFNCTIDELLQSPAE